MRVPSQASDVDQFLDDLFNPVLDQLSDARSLDARSLAASIKGSSKGKSIDSRESLDSRDFAKTIKGGGAAGQSDARFDKEGPWTKDLDEDDVGSLDYAMFARTVKGGGRGVASQQQV